MREEKVLHFSLSPQLDCSLEYTSNSEYSSERNLDFFFKGLREESVGTVALSTLFA